MEKSAKASETTYWGRQERARSIAAGRNFWLATAVFHEFRRGAIATAGVLTFLLPYQSAIMLKLKQVSRGDEQW